MWQNFGHRRPAPLDHIGLVGTDLDSLIRQFARLGFNLTPRRPLMTENDGGRSHPMGQDSAHIMLPGTYIELTSPTGEKANNHLHPLLKRYEGAHILALRSYDAERTRTECVRAGLGALPVQSAARDVIYGRGGKARFKWFGFDAGEYPEGLVCYVEHVTPDIVFQSEMAGHPNGARDLTGVLIAAKTPGETVDRYIAAGGQSTQIICATPEEIEQEFGFPVPSVLPSIAGMSLKVGSIVALRNFLDSTGLPCNRVSGGSLCLTPEYCGGAALIFHED